MKRGLLLLYFFFLLQVAHSQSARDSVVSGSYQDATVEQFVQDLEQQSGFKFYFDTAQLAGTRINATFTNVSIQNALNAAFKHSNIYFSIDQHRRVYLTKNFQIVTKLLLDNNRDTASQIKTESLKNLATKEEKKTAAVENKLHEIGSKTNQLQGGNAILTGYVRHARTGEPVVGAAVTDERSQAGTMTDAYGFYSLTLPRGSRILSIEG